MRKLFAVLLALAMLCAAAVPASAAAKLENEHQIAEVLEITQTAEEAHVMKMYHLTDQQMMEAVENSRDVIPEDYEIHHLSMVRQRDVTNGGEPIELSLRAWGAGKRYLVVLFKGVDSDEWTVVAAAQGEFIDATLPGDGEYALAWSWG